METLVLFIVCVFVAGLIGWVTGYERGMRKGGLIARGRSISLYSLPHQQPFMVVDWMVRRKDVVLLKCNKWEIPRFVSLEYIKIPETGIFYLANDDEGSLVAYESNASLSATDEASLGQEDLKGFLSPSPTRV